MKTEHNDDLERVLMDRNKIERIFNCFRKVSHVFQEFASDFDKAESFPASSRRLIHNNLFSYKEKELPSSSESTRLTRDIACQKNDLPANLISRAVGDKASTALDQISFLDHRKNLSNEMESFGKQYLTMIEERDCKRRKLCQLQAEFISLMLPQFSIIHSIMAESLRADWQNKLNLIAELTRALEEFDQETALLDETGHQEQPPTASEMLLANALLINARIANLNPRSINRLSKYEAEVVASLDPASIQERHDLRFNHLLSRCTDSPANESTDSASECPRMDVDDEGKNNHYYCNTTEDLLNFTVENDGSLNLDPSETPVDLTVSEACLNKSSSPLCLQISSAPVNGKAPLRSKTTKVKKESLKKPCKRVAKPCSNSGVSKYKICLYRDDNSKCHYIGKDRSCNMRQHWLHRHNVENPPDNFYLRKDLTDLEVQVYKAKYEAQKAPFKMKETACPHVSPPPSMTAISAVANQTLSPSHKETSPLSSGEEHLQV